MNTRSFILSVLIAGAIIGVLANFPVLNLINCFLCIWVWVGGALAVVLYRRFQKTGLGPTTGQGAALGAVAGLVGAFVGILVYSMTSFISMPMFASLARFFQIGGDLPFRSGPPSLPSIVASAFFFFTLNAVAYPLFGAISGLIAASLSKEKPAV